MHKYMKGIASVLLTPILLMLLTNTIVYMDTFAIDTSQIPSIAPAIPGEHEISLYTRLVGRAGVMNFSDTVYMALYQGIGGSLSGSFYLELNETTLYTEEELSGTVEYIDEPANFSGIELSLSIDGSVAGEGKEFSGSLRINGTVTISQGYEPIEATIDLPLQISGSYDESTNTTTLSISTSNAYLLLMGSKIDIEYSMEQYLYLSRNSMRTIVDFKAYSNDQMALLMLSQLLYAFFGVQVKGPSPDPVTSKYAITYHADETVDIETVPYAQEYAVNVMNVSAELHVSISGVGEKQLFRLEINSTGFLEVKGDFSKGVRLDPHGFTNIKSLKVTGTLQLSEGKLVIHINGYAEYYTINLYLVQFTYRELVPTVLSQAKTGSRAVIETSSGVKLMLNGEYYDILVFTPANASLASDIYIVVNGTVLESQNPYSNVLEYRVVEGTDRAVVYLFSEENTNIVVEAPNSRSIVFDGGFIGFTGKTVDAVFGSHECLALSFPEADVKGRVEIELLGEPPADLPQGVVNVSSIYNIELELSSKVNISAKLWYDPSAVPAGATIYVAHYTGSEWELLTPSNIDATVGYVEITLADLSPLVAVARPSETMTTTYPTTTTSPTQTATSTPVITTETPTTSTPKTTIPTTTQNTTEGAGEAPMQNGTLALVSIVVAVAIIAMIFLAFGKRS